MWLSLDLSFRSTCATSQYVAPCGELDHICSRIAEATCMHRIQKCMAENFLIESATQLASITCILFLLLLAWLCENPGRCIPKCMTHDRDQLYYRALSIVKSFITESVQSRTVNCIQVHVAEIAFCDTSV